MTRKSDKNQLEPGTVVGFSLKIYQLNRPFHLVALYENNLICIFMNSNENIKTTENPVPKYSYLSSNSSLNTKLDIKLIL